SDARIQPQILFGPGLPDDTQERRIALIFPSRLLAIDLSDQSNTSGDGKLGDQSPDPDEITGGSLDAEPAVEVQREGAELVAHDADSLEPETPLPFFGRRKERARFYRDPGPIFVLENSLLQHALQRERWIDDVELGVGGALDCEFGDAFPVLEQSVVEDCPGDDEGVLVFGSIEREVAELDLDLFGISDRGVGRDERAIGGRR